MVVETASGKELKKDEEVVSAGLAWTELPRNKKQPQGRKRTTFCLIFTWILILAMIGVITYLAVELVRQRNRNNSKRCSEKLTRFEGRRGWYENSEDDFSNVGPLDCKGEFVWKIVAQKLEKSGCIRLNSNIEEQLEISNGGPLEGIRSYERCLKNLAKRNRPLIRCIRKDIDRE